MEIVKKYIDDDNYFDLRHIENLDYNIKNGITIDVKSIWENFYNMTFIQYAIAKRRPKCLKDMLETAYYRCQIPFDKIMSPTSSSTKGNLLCLAIEFGSKNDRNKYEKENNECLKVIIEFGTKINQNEGKKEFNIDILNVNGETPLNRAIYNENIEACQLLIKNGADIFYKPQDYDFVESPLFYLFETASNMSILQKVLDRDVLGDEAYEKYQRSRQEEPTKSFLEKVIKTNINTKEFLSKNKTAPINLITGEINCSKCGQKVENGGKKCSKCNIIFCSGCINSHGCNQPVQPTSSEKKCKKCGKTLAIGEIKECEECGNIYCEDHINDHGCV